MQRLLHSAKFWTAMVDVLVPEAPILWGKYISNLCIIVWGMGSSLCREYSDFMCPFPSLKPFKDGSSHLTTPSLGVTISHPDIGEQMNMEQWLPVPDYEGLYEVSDTGQIRSLPRYDSRHLRQYGGKILKPVLRNGYPTICLYEADQVNRQYVHRLVLRAFCGEPISPNLQANHKNGDRADNRLENLEWMTSTENNLHALRELGRRPPKPRDQRGAANPQSKLTNEDVENIRLRYHTDYHWGLGAELAREYGVSQACISEVVHRERWAHI